MYRGNSDFQGDEPSLHIQAHGGQRRLLSSDLSGRDDSDLLCNDLFGGALLELGTYGKGVLVLDSHCPKCGRVWCTHQDGWPRTCIRCHKVAYNNPVPAVMVLLPTAGGIVMIQRGVEPQKGEWALPGGYQDHGESWQEAGARELREETGIVVDPSHLVPFGLSSPPSRKVVVIFALGPTVWNLPKFAPNEEVLDLRILTRRDTGMKLAFPAHTEMVAKYWEMSLARGPGCYADSLNTPNGAGFTA